jgi:glutamate-5-semialdehyde dehydrogenase
LVHILELAKLAKAASRETALLSESLIDNALSAMADALIDNAKMILTANKLDIDAAKTNGMGSAMLDRLTLNESRLAAMANGIRKVVALPTPVGSGAISRRPNGLVIEQIRVPLGLVGVIFESRPNVTSDVASLCLKTGNACLLRGGKEAINSNRAIVNVLRGAVSSAGVPSDAISLVDDTSRETASEMMKMRGVIDLLIPRGGASLIKTVVEQSIVPVIETGAGNCHTYVHADCDIDKAVKIIENAKCSRPSVCNAMETLLVHKAVIINLLTSVKPLLDKSGVELRGCPVTINILGDSVKPATEEDYATEFNDYILAVKAVESLGEAIDHIEKYTTRHSECIITESMEAARFFTARVDAAAVYVNASTRFTDGEEFGLGAEIGISTAKLHARGPMGLETLTCGKFIVTGNGQVR